jgi:uncharacterized cupredoxin-like copper-binding protein
MIWGTRGIIMFKILQVMLFVLAAICRCNQAIYAIPSWRPLSSQDTADINALLPGLAPTEQELWITPRANSAAVRPIETLRFHDKIEHGVKGRHDKTLPFFNGAAMDRSGDPNPAPSEEIVVANVIATLETLSLAPVLSARTVVRINTHHSREIRIPVPGGYNSRTQKLGAPPPSSMKMKSKEGK